jgi:hypothetical protein
MMVYDDLIVDVLWWWFRLWYTYVVCWSLRWWSRMVVLWVGDLEHLSYVIYSKDDDLEFFGLYP